MLKTYRQKYKTTFKNKENTMWTTPEAVDIRLGFEITLYINNR